jgi:hypothetical protein
MNAPLFSDNAAHLAIMQDALHVVDPGANYKVARLTASAAGNTAAIQQAIDAVYAVGVGFVFLPQGTYPLAASTLSETLDNAGVAVAASTNCIILRKGVSLIGAGIDSTILQATDPTLTVIAHVAPDGGEVRDLTLQNAWVPVVNGAGHGIFVYGTQGGADRTCRNVIYRRLKIKNVGSYGIGLQNGSPTGMRMSEITVDTCGADGLDLKARSDAATEPLGNTAENIIIVNHGSRVTGSAGIDVRGIWNLYGITVIDYGNNAALDFYGIRFRTKPDPSEAYPYAGRRSTLDGFYVRPKSGPTGTAFYGIYSGSDDVHITNGDVDGGTEGVTIAGNVNGNAQRNTIVGVSALNCTTYGMRNLADDTIFTACQTAGNTTAGFRDEGQRTQLIGCRAADTTPLSTASGSIASQIRLGGSLGSETGLDLSSSASGRVNITARGSSTNIDIQVSPKGGGVLRYGSWTSNADAAINGYILVKSDDGVVRKIATIA